MPDEAPEDRADLARRVENVLEVGEPMALPGIVVDRGIPGCRRDADAVMQKVGGEIVVEPTERAPVLGARLDPLVAAAVDPHVAAGIEGAAFRLHFDDAGGAEPKLGGEGAGGGPDPRRPPRAHGPSFARRAYGLRVGHAIDAARHD